MMVTTQPFQYLSVAFASLLLTVAPALSSTSLSTSGWDKDIVLGSGESYATHQKPVNTNIWFTSNLALPGGGGLDATGAYAIQGRNFQFQSFTGGTSNAIVASGQIHLTTPRRLSELSILGSRTGNGTAGTITLNFQDGSSTAVVLSNSSFPNWANGTSAISPNPKLTGDGTTSSFNGAIGVLTLDMANLGSVDHSGKTLSSITLSGVTSNSTTLFALSGVVLDPDLTAPTLLPQHIVDNQNGGPVFENNLIVFTLTFSEGMDASTVSASDFGNAGTALIQIGTITQTSPGVFTIAVTPIGTGTLQFQVNSGALLTDTAGNPLDTSAAILDNDLLDVIAAPADTTPPTPNPMTFAVEPHATSATSIAMEATAASDAAGVEYYFAEASGNPGGLDSGWQSSRFYQNIGLTTGLTYRYTVTARDLSANANPTSASAEFSAVAEAPPTPPAELTLTEPVERQIVQRSAANTGTIRIAGSLTGFAEAIEARAVVMPGPENSGTSAAWQAIATNPPQGNFQGNLTNIPAGGWYQIEVRALVGGSPLVPVIIQKAGVGEVFVTSGQSNSANFGRGGYIPTDDRVSARTAVNAASSWVLAADPLPIAGGTGGSPWGRLGDALAAALDVPVGFVALGVGSTRSSYWIPTASGYTTRIRPTIQSFPVNGFRAILWHQGESDSVDGVSAQNYANNLTAAIDQSRIDAGWSIPWYLSEASYSPNVLLTSEIPVTAGQRLAVHSRNGVFLGPSTDEFHLEDAVRKLVDQIHFDSAGLLDHATQWSEILLGTATLSPVNAGFENDHDAEFTKKSPLADGGQYLVSPSTDNKSPSVLDWRILSASGQTAADGTNGLHNPTTGTYGGAADTINQGVLPNMQGNHAAFLESGTAGNYFLQSYRAAANPNTTYTLTVALGVRDDPSTYGTARLEITANGVVVASASYDKASLDALRGADCSGTFTDASVSWTASGSVTADSLLAVRVVKENGAGSVIDFDHVRFTAASPPQADYHSWISNPALGVAPGQQGPMDDPDADGLPNLIEAWFGTHPGVASNGITALSNNGATFQFNHPRNASDLAGLSATYEWSPNLQNWYGDGEGPEGGVTMQFSTTLLTGEVQVTATSSLPQNRAFIRLVVTDQ